MRLYDSSGKRWLGRGARFTTAARRCNSSGVSTRPLRLCGVSALIARVRSGIARSRARPGVEGRGACFGVVHEREHRLEVLDHLAHGPGKSAQANSPSNPLSVRPVAREEIATYGSWP